MESRQKSLKTGGTKGPVGFNPPPFSRILLSGPATQHELHANNNLPFLSHMEALALSKLMMRLTESSFMGFELKLRVDPGNRVAMLPLPKKQNNH